jgi:putative transposase
MPDYRRIHRSGGTYFFTVVTERRSPFLCDPAARRILHAAFDACRASRPFEIDAIVLLPDHLHAIWTLPDGDADYSTRWASIKAQFTRAWLGSDGARSEQPRTNSRIRHRHRGLWQRRFWEHTIRDEDDLNRHLDYVHYNPVKHGLARCPHKWPYSSFAKWVCRKGYEPEWCCGVTTTRSNPRIFRRSHYT